MGAGGPGAWQIMTRLMLFRKVFAGQSLVALMVLSAALLLLATGCGPRESVQGKPAAERDRAQPAAEKSPDATSTPRDKAGSALEKPPPPTPTTPPQESPVQRHAAGSGDLRIVDYDEAVKPIYINPPVETEIPTPLPPVACDERMPDSDLFTVVTKEYGLSKDYAPDDLVPLADHLPYGVTVGYPTEISEVMLQALVEMIDDMIAEDLQPWVLSGYRSYAAQAYSWDKWNRLYPETAAIVSALPGHSEHQLGTVIDFGSPELPGVVGQPGIEFHTYFYKTSEGQWLADNAYKYGFTLSFTEQAFDITGFYFEPWHYRYVGETMAAQLREQNLTLTEYKLLNEPLPCTP